MSISTVMDGVKTIVEANGYTVHVTSDEMRDKFASVLVDGSMPMEYSEPGRHADPIMVILYDKIKPKNRFAAEQARAVRVETLTDAFYETNHTWGETTEVQSQTSTDGEFRVTELTFTVMHNT